MHDVYVLQDVNDAQSFYVGYSSDLRKGSKVESCLLRDVSQ